MENLANVYAKPFYTSFERQLKLVHDVIKIDKLKFLNSINKKRYGRAFDVLIYGLETMEGLAWRWNQGN